MKVQATIALVIFLFLSACAPTVNTPIPTGFSPAPQNSVAQTLLPDEPPPAHAEFEFKTDFSKHTVPYSEILSGGPPKDGIPALKAPLFVSVSDADTWLKPVEPVILVQVGEDAKAYPIQILIWHEIANERILSTGIDLLINII